MKKVLLIFIVSFFVSCFQDSYVNNIVSKINSLNFPAGKLDEKVSVTSISGTVLLSFKEVLNEGSKSLQDITVSSIVLSLCDIDLEFDNDVNVKIDYLLNGTQFVNSKTDWVVKSYFYSKQNRLSICSSYTETQKKLITLFVENLVNLDVVNLDDIVEVIEQFTKEASTSENSLNTLLSYAGQIDQVGLTSSKHSFLEKKVSAIKLFMSDSKLFSSSFLVSLDELIPSVEYTSLEEAIISLKAKQ